MSISVTEALSAQASASAFVAGIPVAGPSSTAPANDGAGSGDAVSGAGGPGNQSGAGDALGSRQSTSPFRSPVYEFDPETLTSIVIFRDRDTGDVISQFPPEEVIEQFREAENLTAPDAVGGQVDVVLGEETPSGEAGAVAEAIEQAVADVEEAAQAAAENPTTLAQLDVNT